MEDVVPVQKLFLRQTLSHTFNNDLATTTKAHSDLKDLMLH